MCSSPASLSLMRMVLPEPALPTSITGRRCSMRRSTKYRKRTVSEEVSRHVMWESISVWSQTLLEVKFHSVLLSRSMLVSTHYYYTIIEINFRTTLTLILTFLYPVPELLDLVRELRSVNNWKTFGLYLGIKIEKLNAIEMERPFATIEERRTMMLEVWQNNVIPTWSAVVQALVGMGMQRLASNLAQKHGEFSHLDLH